MNIYTVQPGILSVESNIDFVHYFSFGFFDTAIPSITGVVNVKFVLVDQIVESPSQSTCKLDYFYKIDEQRILFDHPAPFGIHLKMLLKRNGDNMEIHVEKNYYRLMKIRMEGIVPPGRHLFNLCIYQLFTKDFFPVHCSAFEFKGEGNILIAASNTGKSFSAFSFVEKGAKLISEDMVSMKGDCIYATPLLSANSEYIKKHSIWHKLKSVLELVLPVIPRKNSQEAFGTFYAQGNFIDNARASNVFILERSNVDAIDRLTSEDALDDIIKLNRYEFDYYSDSMLRAMTYFWKDLPTIEELQRKEREGLKSLLENTNVFRLRGSKHSSFQKLIHELYKDQNK